ncbi:MAG: 7TM diverse intracellular signaling domain-containing protein [Polaromonas sp.]
MPAICLGIVLWGQGRVEAQPAPPLTVSPVQAPGDVPGEGWVVVDTSGALSFEQARARLEAGEGQPLKPQQIMPTGEGRALWYQLKLPAVTSPRLMLLTVPHPSMDSVELYRPAGPGQWELQRSGDMIPVAVWPVPHLYPAFELWLQPGETQPSYLRVAHNYPISVHWVLSDAHAFRKQTKQGYLLMGIYVGLVLLIMMTSSLRALTRRDPVHLFFAGYVLVVALGQLSLTGLGGEYLWPYSAWWNDRAPVVLTVAGATLLHLLLSQLSVDRNAASGLARWLGFMAVAGVAIVLGFLAIGRKPFGSFTAPYYLASMGTYLAVGAWHARRRPVAGRWVLAAMLCLTLGSIFPVLRTLSLMPLNVATQYGAQIGAALEIPLLMVALYFRNREKRENQARVGALPRVDPLSGVSSHGVLLQRLQQLMLHQQRDQAAGAVLRIRLGNAVEIRQNYGMGAAQNAVVHAGACVTAEAQEGDVVGRHRDGDFVLVLQGHFTREQLTHIGQRLIARGLSESPDLPLHTMLQLKVAVAQAPFEATDAEAVIQCLGGLLSELGGRGTALRFVTWPEPKTEGLASTSTAQAAE